MSSLNILVRQHVLSRGKWVELFPWIWLHRAPLLLDVSHHLPPSPLSSQPLHSKHHPLLLPLLSSPQFLTLHPPAFFLHCPPLPPFPTLVSFLPGNPSQAATPSLVVSGLMSLLLIVSLDGVPLMGCTKKSHWPTCFPCHSSNQLHYPSMVPLHQTP